MIGKLERVNLKAVWKKEAYDFTPWLQENIEVLGNAIDLELSSAEREQSAGTFSVDLVAEDASGDTVVIESQYGRSDHDHLGKIITYLTAFEAKAAIWIVEDARPEHVRAITWLNESMSASFYLVKLEAVRIDNSNPAALFTLIVGPSEEGREVGKTKKELATRHILLEKFWTQLLEKAKDKTKLHANRSPGRDSWIGGPSGKMGLGFNYVIGSDYGRVELYIDRGKDSGEENLKIFKQLEAKKEAIEKEFGEPLDWESLDGKRACRIKKEFKEGGWADEEKWPKIQNQMIDAMVNLEKALKPHIAKLDA